MHFNYCRLQVNDVNDPPTLTGKTAMDLLTKPRSTYREVLVPLELAENTGVLVGDLVHDYFEDPEETTLGMCLIMAQSTGQ